MKRRTESLGLADVTIEYRMDKQQISLQSTGNHIHTSCDKPKWKEYEKKCFN